MAHPSKKKKPAAKSPKPPHTSQRETPAPPPDVLAARLEKILRTFDRGFERRALDLLEELWPTSPQGPPERLAWLAGALPERALLELFALEHEHLLNALEFVLPELVLQMDQAAWSQLATLEHPLLAEAQALREASALLAAGEDKAAAERARVVGVRSPLRDVRLFLRALASLYRGALDEARQILKTLAEGKVTSLARGATAALTLISRQPTPPPSFDKPHPWGLVAGLLEAEAFVIKQQPNAALRTLAHLATLYPKQAELLRGVAFYELLRFRKGDTNSDLKQLTQRLNRAFGEAPHDPSGLLLAASGARNEGLAQAAVTLLENYLEIAQPSWLEALAGQDSLGRALVLTFLAETLSGQLNQLHEEQGARAFFFAYDEPPRSLRFASAQIKATYNKLISAASEAVHLQPSLAFVWRLLLDTYADHNEHQERTRTLEAWLKQDPQDAGAWEEAALAAAERGSFHKAQRHLQRAQALEPFSRHLQKTQVQLLLIQARKHLKDKKSDAFAETARTLRALPHAQPAGDLDLSGFELALLIQQKETSAFNNAWDAAIQRLGSPWHLALKILEELRVIRQVHYENLHLKRSVPMLHTALLRDAHLPPHPDLYAHLIGALEGAHYFNGYCETQSTDASFYARFTGLVLEQHAASIDSLITIKALGEKLLRCWGDGDSARLLGLRGLELDPTEPLFWKMASRSPHSLKLAQRAAFAAQALQHEARLSHDAPQLQEIEPILRNLKEIVQRHQEAQGKSSTPKTR